MKKILFIAMAVCTIAGCKSSTSTNDDALKKQIADLEKQVATLKNRPASTSFKYFDSLPEFRKFVAENYSKSTYNYNTVEVNINTLKTIVNSFHSESNLFVSIVFTAQGRQLAIGNSLDLCLPGTIPVDPFSRVCCPPNCGIPLPPGRPPIRDVPGGPVKEQPQDPGGLPQDPTKELPQDPNSGQPEPRGSIAFAAISNPYKY